MILATITPTDISGILVPFTALLLPGFVMAFLFLKIESKNYHAPPIWFHYLKQQIHDIKEISNRYEIIGDKCFQCLDSLSDTDITWCVEPVLALAINDLTKSIRPLEKLLNDLQSPNKETITQMDEFLNGRTDNRIIWKMGFIDVRQNAKYKLSDQDKTYFNSILDNVGKAGTIELINYKDDLCYITEDENVFEAVKEIMSIVAPKEINEYKYKKKYRNDPRLETFRILYEEQDEPLESIFELTIDCSPELKDKQVRKKKIKEIKNEYYQFEYDF